MSPAFAGGKVQIDHLPTRNPAAGVGLELLVVGIYLGIDVAAARFKW